MPRERVDRPGESQEATGKKKPACRQSLPKHHVVWNCLGVVVAGFRNMAWVRC